MHQFLCILLFYRETFNKETVLENYKLGNNFEDLNVGSRHFLRQYAALSPTVHPQIFVTPMEYFVINNYSITHERTVKLIFF